MESMTLGEELDLLIKNASKTQLERFEVILQETRESFIISHDKPENDRFWALIRFRTELQEGRI